jgi:microcystin-dependent protein
MLLDDVMLGEIRMLPFAFVPRGWAFCDGSLLQVAANTALHSIIGFTFGGDGVKKFAVPDLRGRVPMGLDPSGVHGNPVALAQTQGSATVTITPDQVPQHTHPLQRKGATSFAQKTNVVGPNTNLAQLAVMYNLTNNELVPHLQVSTTPDTSFHPATIGPAFGGAQPHDNRQPYQAIGFFIATDGYYPQFD